DAGCHRVCVLTAELIGNMDRVESGLNQRIQGLLWEALLLVNLCCIRCDLVLGQAANSLPECFVLLLETEQLKVWVSCHTFLRSVVTRSRLNNILKLP